MRTGASRGGGAGRGGKRVSVDEALSRYRGLNYSDPFGLCPPQDTNFGPGCPGYFTSLLTAAGGAIGGFLGGGAGGAGGAAACSPGGPVAIACGGAGAVGGAALGAAKGALAGGAVGAAADAASIWFSKQSKAVARAEGLRPQVEEHLGKLEGDPDADAANHWRGEVRGWLDQISRATRDMGRRTGDEWRRFVDEAAKRLGNINSP